MVFGPAPAPRPSRTRWAAAPAVLAAAAVAIAAVGCGSSSDTATAPSSSSSTAAPATSAPTTAAPTTAPVPDVPGQVLIRDYELLPTTATVAPGGTVTWQNADDVDHHLLSDDGTTIDTGTITPGQAAPVTLTTPGTYAYYCDIHNAMTGTVVVG